MKKVNLFLFGVVIAIILVQSVLAVNLNVQKVSSKEVMIQGLDEPATFSVKVDNFGPSDSFSFYTYFGTGITPTSSIQINSGETKLVNLQISPRLDMNLNGYVNFPYFIQGKDKSQDTENFTVDIIPLSSALAIGAGSIDPTSNTVTVYVQNKVNFNFQDLTVNLTSPFFQNQKTINLAPYEKKNFTVTLNKDDFSKLLAGFYNVNANFKVHNATAQISEPIDFTEKEIINEERKTFGLIISTTSIKKINSGNVVGNSEITVTKNIISRIFTSFSEEPQKVERNGFTVDYVWDKTLNPGETYEVDVTTNWIIPFIVAVLIVLAFVLSRKYARTDLVIRKKVAFMNAKGGEFALRVIINVEAKNFVENVKIYDRLPPLVKIYEKFEGVIPKRFNKTRRVFEWEFANLEAGERRTFSYVIYSRVGVLGKFALPETTATFNREGKEKEVSSNQAFFLASERGE